MRVLHVIPSVGLQDGGPREAVLGMCRGLDARGVRTTIATTRSDVDGFATVRTREKTTFEGVEAIFFPRIGERFKYSGSLARWLAHAVGDFDVVHIHAVFSHSSLTAGRACRRRQAPYVLRPLGSLGPWALSQGAWKKQALLGTGGQAPDRRRGGFALHDG